MVDLEEPTSVGNGARDSVTFQRVGRALGWAPAQQPMRERGSRIEVSAYESAARAAAVTVAKWMSTMSSTLSA